MCDLNSKFEEDRTKTAVAIEDDRYFGLTHTQTDIDSSDFIFLQCHALHWTDKNSYCMNILKAILQTLDTSAACDCLEQELYICIQ